MLAVVIMAEERDIADVDLVPAFHQMPPVRYAAIPALQGNGALDRTRMRNRHAARVNY